VINKKRELFFFIVSGILHAAFFYWLLNAHMNVKVFVPQEEIAEVVIVSSGKLRSPILPKSQPQAKAPQATFHSNSGKSSTGSLTPKRQLPKEFSVEKLNLQVQIPPQDRLSVNLDLSLNSQPDTSNDYNQILEDLQTEEGAPIYNLSRYTFNGSLTGRPEDLSYQTSSGGSKGYFNVKHFDIKPWAQRVISRINMQWSIPLAIKVGATGIVGVKTTIKKNGDITSVSIGQPSGLDPLDQAALTAVKNSAPFPSLPGDFPQETVDAYFVFEYGS
jgi:TonB family protein